MAPDLAALQSVINPLLAKHLAQTVLKGAKNCARFLGKPSTVFYKT